MDVLTAAQNVADDFPGGARGLAEKIGKNSTTLSHELKGTGGAKLGPPPSVEVADTTEVIEGNGWLTVPVGEGAAA